MQNDGLSAEEPRPHPDPRLLFVGTQMRFIGACPGCAFTEGKS